jgi:hypothetical protein
MPLSASDLLRNADTFKAAYPSWPSAEPQESTMSDEHVTNQPPSLADALKASLAAAVTAPPVRLCCGKAHWGAVCPDGKVMCCICFHRFEVSDLNRTEDGSPEDVCRGCAASGEATGSKAKARADEMCPGGCGCRLGTDDADRFECGCDEGCCGEEASP